MAATIACGATGTIPITNLAKVEIYTASNVVVLTYSTGSVTKLTATADVADALAGFVALNQMPITRIPA